MFTILNFFLYLKEKSSKKEANERAARPLCKLCALCAQNFATSKILWIYL